jgi:group I intron endonuclease
MYGFIYLTTNRITGKKYIGMCKNTHCNGYLGSGKLLKRAIRKYGRENFDRTILQECETFEKLSKSESYWIKFYNAVESFGFYNLVDGGFGGNSNSLKKYWSYLNKEERKSARNWSRRNMVKINNPMWGKKHSEETKALIGSKSVNRNWNKPNHFGSNNPNAKKVLVEIKSTKRYYDCLKDFYNESKIAPYSTLKSISRDGRLSKKYGIKITYV